MSSGSRGRRLQCNAAWCLVVRVPWQQGLTIAGAGNAAKVDLARRAIHVLRGGKVVYSAARLRGDGAPLTSGDVVRLGS